MAFRQKKIPYIFPFQGHAIADVTNTGHLDLTFDDPAGSLLHIEGEVVLVAGEASDSYAPPFPEWVESVFSAFIGVVIVDARFDRNSVVRIVFADGREVHIPLQPFEHWHYTNAEMLATHQGWLHGV